MLQPLERSVEEKLKKAHKDLQILESIVQWDRINPFYYMSEAFWYVIQCKLQAIIINRLFKEYGLSFPILPCVSSCNGDLESEQTNSELWMEFQDLFDFPLYFSSSNEFGCIYYNLGTNLEDRFEEMSKLPGFLLPTLHADWRYFSVDILDVLGDTVIRIPGMKKLDSLLASKCLSEPIQILYAKCKEFLRFSQPCFLGTEGQLHFFKDSDDGFIHVFFFASEGSFGEPEYFNFLFFYALYGIHLCMDACGIEVEKKGVFYG